MFGSIEVKNVVFAVGGIGICHWRQTTLGLLMRDSVALHKITRGYDLALCCARHSLVIDFARLLTSRFAPFMLGYFSLIFLYLERISKYLMSFWLLLYLFSSKLYNLLDEAPSLQLPRGPNSRIQPGFYRPIPSFTPGSSNDWRDMLSSCSPYTLRELICHTPLKGANREELEKPAFLFGDLILVSRNLCLRMSANGFAKW